MLEKHAADKQSHMEALIAENESVRAVGNMMTNARGDQLNEKGEVVKTAQQIASELTC